MPTFSVHDSDTQQCFSVVLVCSPSKVLMLVRIRVATYFVARNVGLPSRGPRMCMMIMIWSHGTFISSINKFHSCRIVSSVTAHHIKVLQIEKRVV